jgi:lipoic acid synthetase
VSAPTAGSAGEPVVATRALRVRWLGTVPYAEALALQRRLHELRRGEWLLLLEHPHVYTLGVRADPAHVLVDPTSVGADLVRADRGGDVTYHGPGQLVGYPILDVAGRRGGGMADTVAYVRTVEQVLIDAIGDVGVRGAARLDGYPGVWLTGGDGVARKVAAVGVRLDRGRSMHGFALNVAPDLSMFDHIVACGIRDRSVTSLVAAGCAATMDEVVEAVIDRAERAWGRGVAAERARVVARAAGADPAVFSGASATPVALAARSDATTTRRQVRLREAGVSGGLPVDQRRPPWLRAPVRLGEAVRDVGRLVRDLDLVTVCEEAGCPNRSECWQDGTATFMINGDRCTRDCGFCLVDTRRPLPLDPVEPGRVADAVARLGLTHAVVTAVARDDLTDGGAAAFAATIDAIRRTCPGTRVEVLIPDFGGDAAALDVVLGARPDLCNHNLETVARLQRAVRPSAGYARSLAVLARAGDAGVASKSGLVLGMGETDDEVVAALADLAGVGVGIVTLGQYLRPTARHVPVSRWIEPDRFDELAAVGRAFGIGHVEAGPLVRSSYHARQAAEAAATSDGQQNELSSSPSGMTV